jgi:hypothetical protein
MASTYTPIATYTFASDGTGGAQVNFTSIPSTYTDLILVGSLRDTFTGNFPNQLFRVNNDAGSNYSSTVLFTDGATAQSARYNNYTYSFFGKPAEAANTFGTSIMHFMNYSNTTTNKTMINRSGNGFTASPYGDVAAWVHLWRSTAAITSITLFPQTNFAAGSTFTLYGVKSA